MTTSFEQRVQADLTRLRLIERLIHEKSTVWQIKVAGLTVPMTLIETLDSMIISADFPAMCPMDDHPVAFVLADGDEVYSMPLGDEVHSGQPFQVQCLWTAPAFVPDPS